MSQRNRRRARQMWAAGVSLGHIAKALNLTVLSVAQLLTQEEI